VSDGQTSDGWGPGRGPEIGAADIEAIRPAVESLLARLRGLADAVPPDAEPPPTGVQRPRP
jgi:hypothetical protein